MTYKPYAEVSFVVVAKLGLPTPEELNAEWQDCELWPFGIAKWRYPITAPKLPQESVAVEFSFRREKLSFNFIAFLEECAATLKRWGYSMPSQVGYRLRVESPLMSSIKKLIQVYPALCAAHGKLYENHVRHVGMDILSPMNTIFCGIHEAGGDIYVELGSWKSSAHFTAMLFALQIAMIDDGLGPDKSELFDPLLEPNMFFDSVRALIDLINRNFDAGNDVTHIDTRTILLGELFQFAEKHKLDWPDDDYFLYQGWFAEGLIEE